MRVIAGIHRSRILKTVETNATRETKDNVKELIFNVIGPYFDQEAVLDLFAGSGALGIEALSRNASKVVFIDQDKRAIDTIKENINGLHLELSSKIIQANALTYIEKTEETFDIIFLDPPYELHALEDICLIIEEHKLLKKEGVIVLLYHKKDVLQLQNRDIIEYKTKQSGITKISFLKWGIVHE